jgi:hypothetical protein
MLVIRDHLLNGKEIEFLTTDEQRNRVRKRTPSMANLDVIGPGEYRKKGRPPACSSRSSTGAPGLPVYVSASSRSSADAPGLPVNASAPSRSSADAAMEDGDDSPDAPAIGDLSIDGGGEGEFGYDGGADDDYGYDGGGTGTITKPCNGII